MRLPLVLAALLFAGCLQQAAVPEPEPTPAAAALSASVPEMLREKFMTTTALPLPEPLAMPATTTHDVTVPAGLSFFQLAIDLAPSLTGTAPAETASVRVLGPGGDAVFELPPTTAPTKGIAWLDPPTAGAYTVEVVSKGVWNVGLVTVAFPADYTPGRFVNVSYPEQREIDHSFTPKSVTATPGEAMRFTTFDYDPHEGIDNLQHNVFFPDLGVKTKGQTTWGEVRTLDFTAPMKPGKYEFYCEFHERALRGTLVVS
ncbi:MAG TPA: cupredoxin domain-containing protein [Candidatus Thermoplasmatota archaeon]|nr:cupredoxin domain-containing protein [Candidatus Thermoplasmatota archaeon]